MQVPVIGDDGICGIAAINILVLKSRKHSARASPVVVEGHVFSKQPVVIAQTIWKSRRSRVE